MNNLLLNKYQPIFIEDFNYDNDYSEYKELVYNRVKNQFSWKNIVKMYSEYFTEIVK